jgi:hypothetical protein
METSFLTRSSKTSYQRYKKYPEERQAITSTGAPIQLLKTESKRGSSVHSLTDISQMQIVSATASTLAN